MFKKNVSTQIYFFSAEISPQYSVSGVGQIVARWLGGVRLIESTLAARFQTRWDLSSAPKPDIFWNLSIFEPLQKFYDYQVKSLDNLKVFAKDHGI